MLNLTDYLLKEKIRSNGYTDQYLVDLIVGRDWPSDTEIINFCDSDNFGGRVKKLDDYSAIAYIYID
jgi:hypothetical protein